MRTIGLAITPRWRSRTLIGLAMCGMALSGTGCSNSMTPTTSSLAGQWSGTTVQGQPIAFTVSSDEVVTTITIGHAFNGCAGSETFPNLSLRTSTQSTCIPAPCPATITNLREFGSTFGNPAAGRSTDVNGLFLPSGSAQGTVNFRSFDQCGSAIGVGWTATRR